MNSCKNQITLLIGFVCFGLSSCADREPKAEESIKHEAHIPREAIDGYFVREGEPLLGPPNETAVYESKDYANIPEEQRKVILFYTDDGGHGWMQHENTAGSILLAKRLAHSLSGIRCIVLRDTFPDTEMLANASALVLFCNGYEDHPSMDADVLQELEKALANGIGMAAFHWALEPGDEAGADFLNRAIGGHFKLNYSVNPMWLAEFKEIPKHPANHGVNPYTIFEEFYFNIFFNNEGGTHTTLLKAIPPDSVTVIPFDGPRSNNSHVRTSAGQPQILAWTWQRDDGGRSYGFTGAHFHWAWKDDNYRRGALNGIAWAAGVDIPENGIDSPTPSDVELFLYQSDPKPENWRPHPMQPPMDEKQ